MFTWEIAIILGILGACMGSFAGAMTWRLRARQLKLDKKAGEKVDVAELKKLTPLTKVTVKNDHSRCLHCGYLLKWYDLIPIVSWLSLKGKCRNCHKPIGKFELLMELGTAAFFVLSFLFWPAPLDSWYPITQLVLWLSAGVGLAMLFAYDTKWFLLPDRVSFTVIGIGAVSAILSVIATNPPFLAASAKTAQVLSIFIAVAILSGIYWLLYVISKHRWVGFGDVKLGLGLALLLHDWRLAIIALFAANLIGSLIVLPGLLSGKLKPKTHVPFGPLLIAGAIVAQLAGVPIINYYLDNFFYY